MTFGKKFLDLLQLASLDYSDPVRAETWDRVCAAYSRKAVLVKLQEMTDRGYVDYGICPGGAFLTDKGRKLWATSQG